MLVGREAESTRLEKLLDAVKSGPVACVLEGTPGIGKTTLWRESVEAARRRGYEVLETAPSEPDAVVAFSGLGDLLERIPDRILDALPEVQAHALKAALYLSELPEGSRDLEALPRAILRVLRELSTARPVLVAIDDEQWLDPSSARVLAFALSRLREEPIGVIIARRSETGGALSIELGRRFGGRGLESISIEPMPIEAIKRLLEARVGRSIPAPVLRRIHHGAGGNPLWALAIALEIEAGHPGGERAGDLPIPRTLSDAIKLRLRHLDPRTDAPLLVIAALSQPTLAMLQATLPDFALSDLESAEQASVIEIAGDRLRFTHPLLASTHYANTPVSKRRELHRLLATVIEDEEERARHLALGAEAPDGDLADRLEHAAGVAARRGAVESAAQLLEDAARLTPIDQTDAHSARIVASAEHRFTSGEVSRARDMLGEVMPRLASGPLRARARFHLGVISADEPKVAMDLLEAALSDAEADDRLRVQIEWELTFAASAIGQLGNARAHAESAVQTAERLGDPELVARALGELVFTSVITGEPLRDDLLARISPIEDSDATTTYNQPATTVALARQWAGDFEGARPTLQRAAQRALSRGEEWDRVALANRLAELEWEMGNWAAAEQHRQAAQEGMGEFAEGLVHLAALDALFALGRGDLLGARTKVEQGLEVAERTGAALQTARFIPLLAAVELLSGQPDVAHTRLSEAREWLQSIGFGPAGYSRTSFWSLDVEALTALDRLEEADAVLAELRSRADVCRSDHLQAIAIRSEGLLLAARGELSAGIEAMDRALAAHLRCRRPFEHGRTLLEKGSIERRAKRKAAAKQSLEEALAILEPLGAEMWACRARDELSRIGLRRGRATEGLTPAQTRVAELVVAGSSNGEIALELHMSLRTVESHLTRVYQEHGVKSRTQLVAALAASGDPASRT
jgi:DNA-binding CsgD family transcriptional regulator/tetratricopeptide (TPR) repeat protein